MRRAKASTLSRVAMGPKTGRWQPKSMALLAVAAGGVQEPVAELAARDHLPEPRALDLPARGLRDGAGAHQEHLGGTVTARVVDALHDLPDQERQGVAVREALPYLGHHVEPLRAGPLAVQSHRRGVAHPGHVVHDLLDIHGDDVLPAEQDQVLEPPGDEEIAVVI